MCGVARIMARKDPLAWALGTWGSVNRASAILANYLE